MSSGELAKLLIALSALVALVSLSSLLTGCQTMTPTVVTDTSCDAYEPITWSSKDTPETIHQVREHNKVYDELCQ